MKYAPYIFVLKIKLSPPVQPEWSSQHRVHRWHCVSACTATESPVDRRRHLRQGSRPYWNSSTSRAVFPKACSTALPCCHRSFPVSIRGPVASHRWRNAESAGNPCPVEGTQESTLLSGRLCIPCSTPQMPWQSATAPSTPDIRCRRCCAPVPSTVQGHSSP